jgi:hypothetical protein
MPDPIPIPTPPARRRRLPRLVLYVIGLLVLAAGAYWCHLWHGAVEGVSQQHGNHNLGPDGCDFCDSVWLFRGFPTSTWASRA